MSRNHNTERGRWLDPTANEAIYGNRLSVHVAHQRPVPSGPKTIEQFAQELMARKFPDIYRLTYGEIQEIMAEQKKRTTDIRNLYQEMREASNPQRQGIAHQLKTLEIDQCTANLVIERFKRR